MMKKYIITAAASLLLCAGSAALWAHVSSDEFLNANAALLARESDKDEDIYCFDDYTFRVGATVIKCNDDGTCEKEYNNIGYGEHERCESFKSPKGQ